MSKFIYFNITNTCNSNCRFCGADISSVKSKNAISFERFASICDRLNVGRNDLVIINGGEPTMHSELKEKIDYLSFKNTTCLLFSNGRKLNNFLYAHELLKNFNGTVLIPFYGSDSKTHDHWTQRRSSFNESIKGVKNCLELRYKHKINLNIELKLLFFRQLYSDNPQIFKLLINFFYHTDIIISLNTLIFNGRMLQNKNDYLEDYNALYTSINQTLEHLSSFNGKLLLRSIPLCFVKKRFHELVLARTPKDIRSYSEFFYFDSSNENKSDSLSYASSKYDDTNSFNNKFKICQTCPLTKTCDYTGYQESENAFINFLEKKDLLI